MEKEDIAQLLDTLASKAENWEQIGKEIRGSGLDTKEDPLWKYVYAFEYMYVDDKSDDQYKRYGPYAPWIEMTDGVFPPPLEILPEEILQEWQYSLEHTTSPIIHSRLADLLWVRKWGKRPDLFAKQAITAYLEVSKNNWDQLYKNQSLIRALQLCRETKNVNDQTTVIQLILNTMSAELNTTKRRPGIFIPLAESLTNLPFDEIPSEINELLKLGLEAFDNDSWTVENIVTLMISICKDKNTIKSLQSYQIKKWIEESERSNEGLIRISHLEHALELSRNYGQQDVADAIRSKIQSIPKDSLGFKEFSTTVEIPKNQIEKFFLWFLNTPNWEESLSRFGLYGPPSGNIEVNKKQIESQLQNTPLQFLVTRAVIDESNIPICFGTNIEENKQISLITQEAMSIRFFGSFAPEILLQIQKKHGLIPEQELIKFFTTPLITLDIAKNLTHSIQLFYQGDYDSSAHIILPRLETIFRNLSRELGIPIIREPIGSKPGGVVQLGNLLFALSGKMDESWRRYFQNLLTDSIGLNLRNRICHGLISEVGKDDAALLIQAACALRLFRVGNV